MTLITAAIPPRLTCSYRKYRFTLAEGQAAYLLGSVTNGGSFIFTELNGKMISNPIELTGTGYGVSIGKDSFPGAGIYYLIIAHSGNNSSNRFTGNFYIQ